MMICLHCNGQGTLARYKGDKNPGRMKCSYCGGKGKVDPPEHDHKKPETARGGSRMSDDEGRGVFNPYEGLFD